MIVIKVPVVIMLAVVTGKGIGTDGHDIDSGDGRLVILVTVVIM